MAPLYQLTASDQRHRATFNGIWDMGLGFQLSGVYFFGSGERRSTSWGSDLRNTGGANFGILTPAGTTAESLTAQLNPTCETASAQLRARSTTVSSSSTAHNWSGQPIHRVDMRLQKRFSLGGRRNADLMAEVFNIFNHANYGSYTTTLSNRGTVRAAVVQPGNRLCAAHPAARLPIWRSKSSRPGPTGARPTRRITG
jgi:hypothetical protein